MHKKFNSNVIGITKLEVMDPPRVIKTHLPIQLVPRSFWDAGCKVRRLDFMGCIEKYNIMLMLNPPSFFHRLYILPVIQRTLWFHIIILTACIFTSQSLALGHNIWRSS